MIEWDDKYSVGISIIDEQHKKRINVINNVIVLIINKANDIAHNNDLPPFFVPPLKLEFVFKQTVGA